MLQHEVSLEVAPAMRASLMAFRHLGVGLGGVVVAVVVGMAAAEDARLAYPLTRRVNQVDTLHGTKVEDPYRWLEADIRTSQEVADWVAAQNKVTAAYLATIPEREPIKRRLTELWNYEKVWPPHQVAGRFYVFGRNDGLQNHDVLYTAETPDAEPKVLLDPNRWTKDGSAALDLDRLRHAAGRTRERLRRQELAYERQRLHFERRKQQLQAKPSFDEPSA